MSQYTLYKYARARLRAPAFERTSLLNQLTARTIKSMSRAAPTRIHTNRWLVLLNALRVSMPDQGLTFIHEMKAIAAAKGKKAKLGSLRAQLLFDMLAYEYTQEGLIPTLTAYIERFKANDDSEFLSGVASRHNVQLAGCGHFSDNVFNVFGEGETYGFSRSVCRTCAQELLVNNFTKHGVNPNVLIRQDQAVLVRTNHNGNVFMDRRDPVVVFDARRQIYHHRDWSPYSNLVAGYHSSKRNGFNLIKSPWFNSNRRAFGCELEVQTPRDNPNAAAGRVHEVLNPSGNVGEYCYFEQDGSIGQGFELITQPAGLDVHREKLALFLANPDIKRGMRSHEGGSCGFHVHVGRDYLTQSQIFRMQSFLNSPDNEALIKRVARRYASGYAKIKDQLSKNSIKGKETGDRYEALNVTGDKTVEFRIFRGSLRYESIMAALEFVNAVCNFCSPGEIPFKEFNAEGFKRFITRPDNRADTKYLREYLNIDSDQDSDREQVQQAA